MLERWSEDKCIASQAVARPWLTSQSRELTSPSTTRELPLAAQSPVEEFVRFRKADRVAVREVFCDFLHDFRWDCVDGNHCVEWWEGLSGNRKERRGYIVGRRICFCKEGR